MSKHRKNGYKRHIKSPGEDTGELTVKGGGQMLGHKRDYLWILKEAVEQALKRDRRSLLGLTTVSSTPQNKAFQGGRGSHLTE